MKKLTQITAVFMICAILFTSFSPTAAAETYSGTCGTRVTWSLDTATGVLTISGTGKMKNYTREDGVIYIWKEDIPVVPWVDYISSIQSVVINRGVTSIGGDAFAKCINLTSVTIPDSVTSIGDNAFSKCTSLTSITIPDSVKSIGSGVFSGCTSLASITIPDSVTSIDVSSFYNTALYNDSSNWIGDILYIGNRLIKARSDVSGVANIREGTKSIGRIAFEDCKNLTGVNIPGSVTSIGSGAFMRCTSLKSVTIPDSVTSIGGWVFYGCTGLANVTIPDSVTSIGKEAFRSCDSLTSITIPDSVTSIGDDAFSGCDSLTSITIPDSVTTIGYSAFSECTSLTSITIPDSVTSIGNNAFRYCTKLASFNIPDSVTSIGEDVIYDTAYYKSSSNWDGDYLYIGNYLISAKKSISGKAIIREGTKIIADGAFKDCNNLTSITIPNSVTTIGYYAFSGCSGLTSVTIPGSVTTIGYSAFSGCSGLTSISIPDSVTSIGISAFYRCTDLASITIPDSVTSIEDNTFSGCISLTSVNIPISVTNVGNYAFLGCNELKDVYYAGSETDKSKIFISNVRLTGGNKPLTDATWHYNSIMNPFSDVPGDAWYTDPVLWAVKNNVTTGTTKTTFSPDYTCSRSEIITFLWRAYGKPEPAISNPFTDVKESDFYYAPALWAYENGMVSGTEFGGAVPCKRAEAVTFMWKAEGKEASEDASATFTDVTSGEEYAYAVGWALDKKVTTGTTATTFSPDLTCTRAQIVTFLYRYKA